MPESAFEQLLDHLDQWSSDASTLPDLETLRVLLEAGRADGSVDGELHADDTARWLVGIVTGARRVIDARAVPVDDDLAQLRQLVTRWLHPARLDV